MGVLDELESMLGGWLGRLEDEMYGEGEYKRKTAEARTRNLASIAEHVPYLRELIKASNHEDMYSVWSGYERVWLMELGELEYFMLPGGSQYRMLYVGDDGKFYVFGPVDFDKRRDSSGWFDSYDGSNGKPVKLAMQPLPLSEDTDYHLVALVRERVVSTFI